MPLKSETKVIGAHEYTVYQLGAITGREGLRRLTRLISPALPSLAAMFRDAGPEALAAGLSALLEGLGAEDLAYFCDTFAPKSTVRLEDGKSPNLKDIFDVHFAGNYYEMIEWLVFCFEVNYRGFFSGALAKLVSAIPAAPAPSV
jgi:hypothetical protein